MKAQKINKKLNFNKLTISHLSNIHGGEDVNETRTCDSVCNEVYSCVTTCYQYTCPGWSLCPYWAC